MKVRTQVQTSFPVFSNMCPLALPPLPCTHPVQSLFRFLITSMSLKHRLLSLAGLQDIKFPLFKGNLRPACAWLLSQKRSSLKLDLPVAVLYITCSWCLWGDGECRGREFPQQNFRPWPGSAAALGCFRLPRRQLASACLTLSVTVAGWPGPPTPTPEDQG